MNQKIPVIIEVESLGSKYHLDPEFQSLAFAIASQDSNLDVQMPEPEPIDPSLRKVTWGEIINIFLQAVDAVKPYAESDEAKFMYGYIAAKVLDASVKWAQDRFRKPNASKRPKYITIYGPDDKPLKKVMVRTPDGQPEDQMQELERLAETRDQVIQKAERNQNMILRMLKKLFRNKTL